MSIFGRIKRKHFRPGPNIDLPLLDLNIISGTSISVTYIHVYIYKTKNGSYDKEYFRLGNHNLLD